jgi:hypothetical protein
MNEDMDAPILEEPQANPPVPQALLSNPKVPEIIRYMVPIVIVGTIFLLLSGNLSTGASVDLKVSLGGDSEIKLPALFGFSLLHTIKQLYNAGIYPLLALVVVFSGIWPYTKLFFMLHAWVTPADNTHRRERLLLALDALGKFSLVDTYVLVVMMVAFRFHLDLPGQTTLDVFVTPQRGFYGFVVATSISLVVGHLMVFFHRRTTQNQHNGDTTTRESLFDHQFDVQENGPRRQLSRLFQVFLFTCSLLAAALLSLGFNKKSFTFQFGGLAGMALGDNRSTSYSVLSLGTSLSQSVDDPSSNVGIFFLQGAFFFYAVVTPLVCLSLLSVLLICPMTLATQRKVLVLAEIANAWSAVEVFALSIIAALLQISTFASFIIGDKCDLINQLLEDIFDGEIHGDTVCYSVVASVQSNCWYLVAGVFLNSFFVSVVLRFAHCAMDERIARSQLRRPGVAADPPNDLILESTIARTIFGLPVGSILFENATHYFAVEQAGGAEEEVEEEEEEELPEWHFWF